AASGWRRIPATLAPDLGAAEERARLRPRQRLARRISAPGLEHVRTPPVDLGEPGPAPERPAVFDAERLETLLGEHDIRIAGRVAVRRAIADEDHRSACGLVAEDAVALAGSADEAARMAVRKRDRGPPVGVERRLRRDDRQVADAEPLE